MDDILRRILKRKAEEIHERAGRLSQRDLLARLDDAPATRGFIDAIQTRLTENRVAVIAEIKKASPSKGVIRDDFDPAQIALSYERAAAACLSVLTDSDFFQGKDDDLKRAHCACSLPILRKDFIIDRYQIYEARSLGADCILLIAAALDDVALIAFSALADALGMDVLLEVHNAAELQRALRTKVRLIGINNRNLHTFETSLDTTLLLRSQVPDDRIVVTESGISSIEDIARLRKADVHAFLIGETFMRTEDPGAALRRLFPE